MFKALTRLTMLTCIAAVGLAACDDNSTADSAANAIAPTVVVEPDQVFELYNDQARFVSAARENPDGKLSDLYAEHVIDPYWERCFSAMVPESEPAHFAARMALRDIDRLSVSVEALRTGEAAEIVATALAETRGNVDSPPVTVCVMAGYPTAVSAQLLDDTGGVMSLGGEQTTSVVVNPEMDGWQELLGYTIARDCYQLVQEGCCWGPDQAPTLLEAVVSQGKAHSFAELLLPAVSSRQTNVLTLQQEAAQWERMSPDLTSRDPALLQNYLLIGRSWATTPRWTGHTIGYHIEQAYLDAHPEATIEDWTMLDAATLLADTGYTGRT